MIRLLAALLLTLVPHIAWAIDAVSATVSGKIEGNGVALITIRWSIQVSNSSLTNEQRLTITSTGGQLTVGAFPAVPTGGPISRTVTLPPASAKVVRITERLRIDRTSAKRAVDLAAVATFQRVFADNVAGTFVPPALTIPTGPGQSGAFSLRSLNLRFDDGSQVVVVGQGEALRAEVSITTSGRGVIEGKWEIAGPDGGFRVLARERNPAGGPTRTLMTSPALPTDRPGQYRIRFSMDGDGERSGDPVITYFVDPKAGAAALVLEGPPDGAALGSRTTFRWQEVSGAARYRIEFLAEGGPRPLAAVETTKAAATVRSFTLDRIRGTGALVWQVVAMNADGAVIARSAARRIGAP